LLSIFAFLLTFAVELIVIISHNEIMIAYISLFSDEDK